MVDPLTSAFEAPDTGTSTGFARWAKVSIAAVIAWNLWWLRATLTKVAYLNDSTMHESMVRFANQALDSFHLPMTQWYPYLNLGSPQFLHYQGLAATAAGFLGLLFGSNTVFVWSLFLLIAFWPLVIYRSATVFGLPPGACLAAALLSPFLISVTFVSFEQKAYIWIGFGIWAQLCASWLLPLAWAWTWRAMSERRYVFRAVLLVSLTAALHFETGYSAFGAVLLFPFLIPSVLGPRLKNAAIVLLGALGATSWITIPLLVNARWAAINTALAQSGLVRGYGARQDLRWLLTGQLFDAGRFPIVSLALGVGVVASFVLWKAHPVVRALVGLFVGFFIISWGPTTWGSFASIIPGHADIYFRRFQASVSLAGIYLAGLGIAWLSGLLVVTCRSLGSREPSAPNSSRVRSALSTYATVLVAVAATLIAIPRLYSIDQLNTRDIATQRHAESTQGKQLAPLISYVLEAHDGRVYAGMPTNWGEGFTVGYVPVFEYLVNKDVDQVGFTLRTASLMSQPEDHFDQSNASDYALYGIRYLLLPRSMKPPVPARSVEASGKYHLWEIPQNSYFSIVVPSGTIDENKGTLALQSRAIQDTRYFAEHLDFKVIYPSDRLAITDPTAVLEGAPGTILHQSANLLHGTATAEVKVTKASNVVLSASFDPGWNATVDGHAVATEMLAPAVVSVPVPPGVHTVTFTYQGFQWYLELFLIASVSLWAVHRTARRAKATPLPDDAA